VRQPWIGSARFDAAFILGPALLCTAAVLALRPWIAGAAVSPALWALLVVGVDVSHVYGTLWRTYLDRAELARRRTLYVLAPLLGWAAFACLYGLGAAVFWRALAYLAVFHFVRQQYGLMMIYGRHERGTGKAARALDKAAIYGATLFPLAWWHTHARHFTWFVDGDFVPVPLPWLGVAAGAAYAAVLLCYAVKEALAAWRDGFNWPRNLLLAGTAGSWFVGIVALDSDLAFTALNVVAHGVPYTALVWLYGRAGARTAGARRWQVFTPALLPVFLGLPLLLAYAEEGVWDGMVWADHPALFPGFDGLPFVEDPALLALLVPLLALPQITHYVLDAFIWRVRGSGDATLRVLLG
jgi:hypothetical protein